MQLFQQELSSRQIVADAIRGSVDNSDSEVGAQIEALNKAWQDVVRLAELRDSRLHEALALVCGAELTAVVVMLPYQVVLWPFTGAALHLVQQRGIGGVPRTNPAPPQHLS